MIVSGFFGILLILMVMIALDQFTAPDDYLRREYPENIDPQDGWLIG